ncbi:MAG TPA: serine/threonine-protein kinase [Luteitalea sp.]|nr:serine/threonine-protein kinase [Luteitalea sp.]
MSDLAPAVPAGAVARLRPRSRTLRRVTDALAMGTSIDWLAAEHLADTPQERLVTRQLRLVAALAAQATDAAPRSIAPTRLRTSLWRMARDARRAVFRIGRRWRDHETDLARVATAMSRARTPREIASTMAHGLRETLGTRIVAVVHRVDGAWQPLIGTTAPVPADSGLTAVLDSSDLPVRLGARSPLFALLPTADRRWLTAAGIEAVVRLAAGDGRTIAALLLGPPSGPHRYKRRDLAFAAAVAATAAVGLDACARTGREVGVQAIDDELAFECAVCGRITAESGVCRCGAPRQLAALPMQLAGKFRLERRLGRGGMGVVYLAVDRFLGRLVALKTMPCLAPPAVAALHAEARAMAAVEHPSMAIVYGLEIWRDTPVLVTEYLPGGTLAGRLAHGPLPLREAVTIGIALAATLADLHARGWLHRDIKPANIGIARSGAVKLLDFGLTHLNARTAGTVRDAMDVEDDRRQEEAHAPLAGTPLYLSPEAFAGCAPSPGMDVWSLSLVVFEMIAGCPPWRPASLDELQRQVRRTEVIDVRQWAPATPSVVAAVLTAALHPDASVRLSDARALGAALEDALERL